MRIWSKKVKNGFVLEIIIATVPSQIAILGFPKAPFPVYQPKTPTALRNHTILH